MNVNWNVIRDFGTMLMGRLQTVQDMAGENGVVIQVSDGMFLQMRDGSPLPAALEHATRWENVGQARNLAARTHDSAGNLGQTLSITDAVRQEVSRIGQMLTSLAAV